MALTLTKYPVTSDTKINNIFAGFEAVELEYKREDVNIISISQGVDNNILVTFSQNVTGLGEYVYIYSESVVKYEGNYKVLSSTSNTATLELQYAGSTAGGYCNYKENYFVEYKLVNPLNNDILVYPVNLSSSGTAEGSINLNVSSVVDFLQQEIAETTKELTKGRVSLQVMYREVWKDNENQAFILEDLTPIVIVFSAENSEVEQFIKGFDEPVIYAGYTFTLRFLHSLENLVIGNQISILFDELDINKDIIVADRVLKHFKITDYGQLEINFNDYPRSLDANTQFVRFKINEHSVYDYATSDYSDNDYLTINT